MSNTLFNKKLLTQRVISYPFPADLDDRFAVIAQWRKALLDGKLEAYSEQQLEQAFNRDILSKILGYRDVLESGHEFATFMPKMPTEAGTITDAALGYFDPQGQKSVAAAVEIKSAINRAAIGSRGFVFFS